MAVCLHCLHEARVAARDRRHRAIMRFGVWTLILAVVGVVGAAGVNAASNHPQPVSSKQARRAARTGTARPDSVTTVATAAVAPVVQQGAPAVTSTPLVDSASHSAPAGPAAATPVAAAPVAASRPDSAARPPVAVIAPVIPEGRTNLHDSLYVERRGDTVVVHFDTSPARTRRADKFESMVRETLRTVYGPIADTALAAVPAGRLAMPNELVTTLPAKGIHLAASRGARIAVWPETRAGRDGPLVVAYRTVVER